MSSDKILPDASVRDGEARHETYRRSLLSLKYPLLRFVVFWTTQPVSQTIEIYQSQATELTCIG
jgi:hypothetical protein